LLVGHSYFEKEHSPTLHREGLLPGTGGTAKSGQTSASFLLTSLTVFTVGSMCPHQAAVGGPFEADFKL